MPSEGTSRLLGIILMGAAMMVPHAGWASAVLIGELLGWGQALFIRSIILSHRR